MLTKHRPLKYIVLCSVALTGVVLRIYETSLLGAGISSDSVNYIATARSLLLGEGFVSFGGRPFVHWPPLFPSSLALLGLTGIDPAEGARYFNATVFGLLLLVSGLYLFETLRSTVLAFLGSILFLVAAPLSLVSVYAWSEPLFLLFVLLFLRQIARTINDPAMGSLLLTAAFAALGLLTRHVGITLVGVGLLLLISQPGRSAIAKIRRCVIFSVVSLVPFIAWIFRTWLVAGTIAGGWAPASATLPENFRQSTETILSWILPIWRLTPMLGFCVLTACLLAITGVLVISWRKSRRGEPELDVTRAIPHALFSLVYVVFLILSASTVSVDGLGDRLMSPIYVSMWFLALLALDRIFILVSARQSVARAAQLVVIVGFSVWLIAYPARYAKWELDQRHESGAGGYATQKWWDDQLVTRLRAQPLRGVVYSNAPDALYFLTGIAGRLSPRARPYASESNITEEQVGRAKRTLAEAEVVYLVWFNRMHRNYLLSESQLSKYFEMRSILRTSDGTIYRVLR